MSTSGGRAAMAALAAAAAAPGMPSSPVAGFAGSPHGGPSGFASFPTSPVGVGPVGFGSPYSTHSALSNTSMMSGSGLVGGGADGNGQMRARSALKGGRAASPAHDGAGGSGHGGGGGGRSQRPRHVSIVLPADMKPQVSASGAVTLGAGDISLPPALRTRTATMSPSQQQQQQQQQANAWQYL
jgi:hypothetical protein